MDGRVSFLLLFDFVDDIPRRLRGDAKLLRRGRGFTAHDAETFLLLVFKLDGEFGWGVFGHSSKNCQRVPVGLKKKRKIRRRMIRWLKG